MKKSGRMERAGWSLAVCGLALWAAVAPAMDPTVTSQPATQPAAAKSAEVYTAWPFDAAEAARRQDETAKALGLRKVVKVDLGKGVAIDFVLIPAGKYRMGEAPGREVTIDQPFYLGKYAVTQAQYARVVGGNPSVHKGEQLPADTVTWAAAMEFARQASDQTKKKIVLPSEAQWEFACRAGTDTRCYWGDDMTKLGDYCWWHDNCLGTTHPVGQKKPNAFGLYDMMGNVWQWCGDGGPDAKEHVCRGPTFGSREPMFKSSIRWVSNGAALVNDRFGFRVALEVE